MTRLLITADDYGLTKSINTAVENAYNHNRITRTSIMVTAPAADDAVRRSKRSNIPTGVHLTATRVPPITATPRHIGGTSEHPPSSYRQFVARYTTGQVDTEVLKNEWSSQIEWLIQQGITPNHLDSHQHLHLLPPLFTVVLKLARKYSIPFVRTVYEPSFTINSLPRFVEERALNIMGWWGQYKIKQAPTITTAPYFIGANIPWPFTASMVRKRLNYFDSDDTVEFAPHIGAYVHPAHTRHFPEPRAVVKNNQALRSLTKELNTDHKLISSLT